METSLILSRAPLQAFRVSNNYNELKLLQNILAFHSTTWRTETKAFIVQSGKINIYIENHYIIALIRRKMNCWSISYKLFQSYSSLAEQFPTLQVLETQETFPLLLITSHSSKLLTCIPHEVHIEDTILSSNSALKLYIVIGLMDLSWRIEPESGKFDRQKEQIPLSLGEQLNLMDFTLELVLLGMEGEDPVDSKVSISPTQFILLSFSSKGTSPASCVAWGSFVASEL